MLASGDERAGEGAGPLLVGAFAVRTVAFRNRPPMCAEPPAAERSNMEVDTALHDGA